MLLSPSSVTSRSIPLFCAVHVMGALHFSFEVCLVWCTLILAFKDILESLKLESKPLSLEHPGHQAARPQSLELRVIEASFPRSCTGSVQSWLEGRAALDGAPVSDGWIDPVAASGPSSTPNRRETFSATAGP